MKQESNIMKTEYEVSLRDLLLVLFQKWWVVVIVLVVTVAGATALSFLSTDVYEIRTSIFLETDTPLEVLSASASTDVLHQSIISELDLRDPATGDPLKIQQLESMIKLDSKATGQLDGQPNSHLFTLTVQGENPELLKPIAEIWEQLFTERSNVLFEAGANRSYDIVFNRFQEASRALREKEDEKLAYQRANPIVTQQSQLTALTNQYQDSLRQLQSDRTALIGAQAMLKSTEEDFGEEPQLLTLERAISKEGILVLLANNPDEQTIDGISDLVVADQEPNELYFLLKSEVVTLRADVASLDTTIAYLESLTAELETSVEQESNRFEEIQTNLSRFDQDISILTNNFNGLSKNLQEVQIIEGGQPESIQVVEPAVEPQEPLPKRGRRQILLVGAALGLILGVALAFLIHYLQNPAILIREE